MSGSIFVSSVDGFAASGYGGAAVRANNPNLDSGEAQMDSFFSFMT
jgi:hypothetical protein